MRFEGTKARLRETPLVKSLMAGPLKVLERIHAPAGTPSDLPGQTHDS